MFRKLMLAAVLGLVGFLGFPDGVRADRGLGGPVVRPAYQLEVYVTPRSGQASWGLAGTFSDLKKARAALEASLEKGAREARLVVLAPVYQVQTRGCSRSAWRPLASFMSRQDAQAQVDALRQKNQHGRIASLQVQFGDAKARRSCVVYSRETAEAVRKQLVKDGVAADNVTIVDQSGEW
jgi:hypothetical protein